MANPHKGETELVIGDDTFIIRFTANAICEAEEALGKTIIQITDDLAGGKISMILVRGLLWAGLRDKHPKIDLRQAGDMIVAAGGMMPVFLVISDAFAKAFPPPGQSAENPIEESAAKASNGAAGIGRAS
jgi:hypothetical protein